MFNIVSKIGIPVSMVESCSRDEGIAEWRSADDPYYISASGQNGWSAMQEHSTSITLFYNRVNAHYLLLEKE